MALQKAIQLFLTPFKFKTPALEKQLIDKAKCSEFTYGGEDLKTFSWGPVNGKLILLMHGWSGRASQFVSFVEPLVSRGFHVVAFDAPAHGKSDKKTTNIIQFSESIEQFLQGRKIHAVVGHSLGSIAILLMISRGFVKPNKVVNIASPTISQDVIDIFRSKVGISKKIHDTINEYTMNLTSKPFSYYSGVEIAERIGKNTIKSQLIVHDINDKEAPINHAHELYKRFPNAELFETNNLGHVRILRNNKVISKIADFINSN
jgi:esterase/lipase